MPPKGKAKTAPRRSERYQLVLQEIAAAKTAAKQALVDLRKRRRAEKQRHQRVIKKASMLGASELMEIAGLRNMTMQDLARFATEMGVADAVAPAASAEVPNPVPPDAHSHDSSSSHAMEADHPPAEDLLIDIEAALFEGAAMES